MDPSLEKLARILDLERQQGYQDRAVIGGLGSFLVQWATGLGRDVPDEVRQVVGRLDGYADLAPPERRERVAAVAARLGAVARPGVPAQRPALPQRPPAGRRPAVRTDSYEPAEQAGATHEALAADDPAVDRSVLELRGVGAASAEHLARLGITSLRDLLYHAPLRYNDFSRLKTIRELRAGEVATIVGTVWDVRQQRARSGLHILTVILSDTTATIGCTFFNQPFLEREFRQGRRIVVSGAVTAYAGRLGFRAPEWEPLERDSVHTGRLVPVYPLTRGITQRWLRRQVKSAVDQWVDRLADPIPTPVRERLGLLPLSDALRALHGPPDEERLAAARRRLAFDELFALQVWLRQRRRAWQAEPGLDLSAGRAALDGFVGGLPFALTAAQVRAIEEIAADLGARTPMSRLLQGDVGSGKTVVAVAATAMCVGAGRQAALMVPTEILADQHLATAARLLGPLGWHAFDPERADAAAVGRPPTFARLVGGMRARDKEATIAALAAGTIDVVVGTHAVIQSSVAFAGLGLAVIDEQHRFGVLQRDELALRAGGDGHRPHVLIMTATPIPRTLAQAISADLDQSVVDELPPGREPVRTYWLRPRERERAYAFIRHRVTQGEQAFVVCPRVEDVDDDETRAAVTEHERLSAEVFPDLRVGVIHGRLRPGDKDAVMTAFRDGEVDVLVATSVIEVGVDVPNATVMVIEGADRFGLAQLHQFRGRVGRGSRESACLLLADDPSPAAAERLEAMTRTTDGLALAERDLEMRGPGDYFGVQQSGVVDRFRFARLTSSEALRDAQQTAEAVLASDPALAAPEWAALLARVAAFDAGARRA